MVEQDLAGYHDYLGGSGQCRDESTGQYVTASVQLSATNASAANCALPQFAGTISLPSSTAQIRFDLSSPSPSARVGWDTSETHGADITDAKAVLQGESDSRGAGDLTWNGSPFCDRGDPVGAPTDGRFKFSFFRASPAPSATPSPEEAGAPDPSQATPGARAFGVGVGSDVTESYDKIPPPTSAAPVFRDFFDAPTGFRAPFGSSGDAFNPDPETDANSDVYLTVGGGRLFVSAESRNRVYVYDAATLQPLGDGIPVTRPEGIAYYHDELFVLSRRTGLNAVKPGLNDIDVYSPDGSLKRTFVVPLPQVSPGGIDVAWNEIWIHMGAGLTLILDAQTGLPKGIHGRPAQEAQGGGPSLSGGLAPFPVGTEPFVGADEWGDDYMGLFSACYDDPTGSDQCPGGAAATLPPPWGDYTLYLTQEWAKQRRLSNWRDVSVAPDINGVLEGRHLLSRDAAQDVLQSADEADSVSPVDSARLDRTLVEGTDVQWGMGHVFSVDGNRQAAGDTNPNDDRGTELEDWALSQEASGAWRLEPYRSMQIKQVGDPGSRDVAYNYRGARIDWSGTPTTSEWLNGQQPLDYIVSDADIYLAGARGEHYYELARLLDHVALSVDGHLEATSSLAKGTLTVDTERRNPDGSFTYASGVHTLKLTAYLTDGTSVEISNRDFRIDHDPPFGDITSAAGKYASGQQQVTGSMTDLHKGPKDWQARVSPAYATSWSPICTANAPGPYQCSWDTTAVADGRYRLQAVLTDAMTNKHPNVSTAEMAPIAQNDPTEVIVDNQPPALSLSGEMTIHKPFLEGNTYGLQVSSQDAGSGVKSIEVLVDGVRQDYVEQPCTLGGCSMDHQFSLIPGNYSEGSHTAQVVVTDYFGRTTSSSWTIDVERWTPPVQDPQRDDYSEAGGASAASSTALTPAAALAALPAPYRAGAAAAMPNVLPCTGPDQPANFGVYSLNPSFEQSEGLPLTAILRRCALPYQGERVRANYVSYIYGDCQSAPDQDECAAPVEIQSWPVCERNPSSYQLPDGSLLDHEPLQIPGIADAWWFPEGQRLEVYAGDTTIVIFGADEAQMIRAAQALRANNSQLPPGPSSSTDPGGLANSLPTPVAGAMKGAYSCVPTWLSQPSAPAAVPTINLLAKGAG